MRFEIKGPQLPEEWEIAFPSAFSTTELLLIILAIGMLFGLVAVFPTDFTL